MKAKIRYTNIELNVSACYDESGWFMGFTDGSGHYYRAADLVFPDDNGELMEMYRSEQKPAELPKSEGYSIDGLHAAIDILQKTLGEVDGYQTDDGILEHKCAISAVKELYEQKPVARENDFVSKPIEWSYNFEENVRDLLHDKLTWHSEDGSISSTVFIDDKTLKDIICGIWFYVGKEALKYPNKKLNVTEWSEDYREEDLRTRFAFYTYKDEDDVLYLSNVFVEETSRNKGFGTKILAAAEKVAETLGAINIRLKVKKNSPANAWYRKNGYGYLTFEGDYDWLEKTLEYLKPSKKEWSEEDEEMRNLIVAILEVNHPDGFFKANELGTTDMRGVHTEEIVSWLKSLRPQPHWTPSKEQMEALENEIKFELSYGPHTMAGILQTLYDDLQKLL